MTELTAPRRSLHPQARPQARPADKIPLAEIVVALGIDIPQLELYTRVSKDLQNWIAESKRVFREAEGEAEKVTPELFVEYCRAQPEDQAEIKHQLDVTKTNARMQAKSDWYEWKLQWVEGLCATAERELAQLEEDSHTIQEMLALADENGVLEQEYQDLVKTLEAEQAEIAEIEACDQEYLEELKGEVEEQRRFIEDVEREISQVKSEIELKETRLREAEAEKQEIATAILLAKSRAEMHDRSEVELFQLKSELEALQEIHQLAVTKVSPDVFEYVYASQFKVSIPCRQYQPIPAKLDIGILDSFKAKVKDDFPRLTTVFLDVAKATVLAGKPDSVREIFQTLVDFWTGCSQLRGQLSLLSVSYPVQIEPVVLDGAPGFKADAKVLFRSIMAKAHISFTFPCAVISGWPYSIDSIVCDALVGYGPLNGDEIRDVVTKRLSSATATDNYACLLDACIEAQDVFGAQ
ncbi:hypothetical protein FISHEDRAFT_49338 [Fistulina hepatica ATCC 64428]|uniref:Spc7 kinetochore protein domain-containing protein n=1 Tax=Fistulina hepatica ATCC 64428 TaxID=1128425 RepID=A0A0D7A6F7_9AGAR|nr:hypothetical protein FISHEDRAFT_49338 [Fistulina hepatica ATCC 64428]